MQAQQQGWPDADGTLVRVGDWIAVWCTWTGQLKFEGRAVQVVDVLAGDGQAVFRVRDPDSSAAYHYMSAGSGGFRRVSTTSASGVMPKPQTRDVFSEETRPLRKIGDRGTLS